MKNLRTLLTSRNSRPGPQEHRASAASVHVGQVKLASLGLMLLVAVLASGCNSTPKKPPPPKPITEPLPTPQSRSSTPANENRQLSGGQYEPQPASQSSPPPSAAAPDTSRQLPDPSDEAAEVQVEEYAVDENGNRIELTPARDASPDGDVSGSGGSVAPQMAGNIVPPGGDSQPRESAAGVVDLTGGGPQADPDLTGPTMRIGAQTDEEKLAVLDDELNSQMSAFDERMRRARLAAEEEREQATLGGSAGSAYGATDGQGRRVEQTEIRGAGGGADRGTGLGNTPDLAGETGSSGNRVAKLAAPPDIPDGRDDDIVARQLREAADKETDPVLREKLWEEYRKYKAGL